MAVNDNNPLYGSFTFGGGYSLCNATTVAACPRTSAGAAYTSPVADNYWADFLFGIPAPINSPTTSSRISPATCTSPMRRTTGRSLPTSPSISACAGSTVALRRALQQHLQLRSRNPDRTHHRSRSRRRQRHHARIRRRHLRQVRSSTRTSRTSVHASDSPTPLNPRTVLRGGFGISYSHYTRAGSGDILGINAPQAQFAAVVADQPIHHQPLLYAAAGADHPDRLHHALLLLHRGPGLSLRARHHLQQGDRQHHLHPQKLQRQLRGELLPQRSATADEEQPPRHRLRRQPRRAPGRLPQRQPEEPRRSDSPAHFQLAFGHHRRRQRVLLQLQFAPGQVRAALSRWSHPAELVHLGARARQRLRLPRRQHTLAPGCQQPRRRLRAVRLQPAHREHHQPRLRASLRQRPPVPLDRQLRHPGPCRRMAALRRRQRSVRHAVQPHLQPQ